MSSIFKVFLLLAVMVCISKAQLYESGQHCLCQHFREKIVPKSKVQIYPATAFCNKVEIVVTTKRNIRYCLEHKPDTVNRLMNNMKKRTSQTS